LPRRYIMFLIGLTFNAFGVAFITKASLGTSPIAAIPYSLSLIVPSLSLGNWVVIFNILLVLIQLILLKRDANKIELLMQVGIAFVFGYCIDLSLLCIRSFSPATYAAKLMSLLAGCVIIAMGAYLQVTADVVMLPGDAFVRAIARIARRQYGGVRVICDISMSVIAAALCLIFLRELLGVREGTIITAFLVGNIIKLFTKLLLPLKNRLLPEKTDG